MDVETSASQNINVRLTTSTKANVKVEPRDSRDVNDTY